MTSDRASSPADSATGIGKRPVIRVPLTPTERVLELVSVIGLLLHLFLVTQYWHTLPARVPSHYGPSGKPDAWGGKGALVFLLAINVIVYVGMTIVARYPQIYNYPVRITQQNAQRQYLLARFLIGWIKTVVIWMFAYISWRTMQVALGRAEGLGPLSLIIFLTFIFGAIGIYFYRAYKAR